MGVELARRRREKNYDITIWFAYKNCVLSAEKFGRRPNFFFEILFSLKRPKMRFSAEGGKFLDLTPFLRIPLFKNPPLFVPDLQQGGDS